MQLRERVDGVGLMQSSPHPNDFTVVVMEPAFAQEVRVGRLCDQMFGGEAQRPL